MSRRRRPKGNPFPFLPVPKLGPEVKKPAALKPVSTGLVKASPILPSDIGPIDSGSQFDDRMSYRLQQEGAGFIDQKAFQIQKTPDGWRACAMWKVEGKGEIPAFLQKVSCNLDLFNEVFNLGLRMDPHVKDEKFDGGLFAIERAEGDPIADVLRNVIGAIRETTRNVGYFDDGVFEEGNDMT